MKEIEVLIEVLCSKEQALSELKKFTFQGIKKTIDIYFFDPLRQDLQPKADGRLRNSFRLRQKDGKYFLAYKIDNFKNNDWIYSDEHEVSVGDFDIALSIIKQLGLQELVRVENEKHIFMTPKYEIVLEDVKDLGLFLEVEKLSEVPDNAVADAKQEIRNFIKKLGIKIGNELNAGKPELMLKKHS